MSIFQDATDLLFPRQCPGCGIWDQNLCGSCLLLAGADPQLIPLENARGLPAVPVWTLGKYGGELRRVILAAKHERGTDLSRFLFQAGANLAQPVAPTLKNAVDVWVVPAPSSRRRRWDRAEVTGHIAAGVVAGLKELLPGVSVRHVDLFEPGRGLLGGLLAPGGTREKSRRRCFSLKTEPPASTCVIAVDDVLTTGGTMLEMWRNLGLHLQAGTVLAAA